jgi:hypothetical protein
MRTGPPDSSVEVSDLTSQGPQMSSKRVTIHRRRICAMGAGVLLLLGDWPPIATAARPAHRRALLSQIHARCDELVLNWFVATT